MRGTLRTPAVALAAACAVLLAIVASGAHASDRTIFQGCVVGRTDTSLTLATSGDEQVTIDTTWLRPDALANALTDCVTITAVTVDGHYVAESIEAGDERNEVHAITNETTADRETRSQHKDDDDKGGKNKDK